MVAIILRPTPTGLNMYSILCNPFRVEYIYSIDPGFAPGAMHVVALRAWDYFILKRVLVIEIDFLEKKTRVNFLKPLAR